MDLQPDRQTSETHDSLNSSTEQSPAVTALPKVQKRSKLAIIALIFAFVIPPLGAALSISLWLGLKTRPAGDKKYVIAGTIIGFLLTLPFLLFCLFLYLGGFRSNGAQKEAMPIMAKIDQLKGKKICDNGDSGYGIDNRTPWYDIYYQIPDSPRLIEDVQNLAENLGYQSEKTISDTVAEEAEGENAKSDYLIFQQSGKRLQIIVYRNATVSLGCSNNFDAKQTTGVNTAILRVSLSLPRRGGE